MEVVRLPSETDFAGWREAARSLRARGMRPQDVLWTVERAAANEMRPLARSSAEGGGDQEDPGLQSPPPKGFCVPREFMALAEAVVLHRSDERFDLLYRL